MNHQLILDVVKKALKKKGLQYKDLSKALGMSDSGVKKLLTAKDISLKRLTQIVELAGLELVDVLKLVNEQEVKSVELTKRQEQSLFENPLLFRVFWFLTIEEKPQEELAKIEKLSHAQTEKSLLKLENLDLIKRNQKGEVVSTHKGLYRWVGESVLLNKLHHDWSHNTLKKVLKNKESRGKLYRLSYLRLTKQSRDEFFKRLTEVADDFARRSQREKIEYAASQLIPISLLFALDSSGFLDPSSSEE